MKWILGLGNPGRQYQATRHNLGWQVVERLRRELGATPSGGNLVVRRYWARAEDLTLLLPQTYMNRSGQAVAEVRRAETLEPADLLVVADDLHLPLGRARLRGGGGSGGHKGLESVQEELGTDAFARLRLGVGRPDDSGEFRDFVLDGFEEDEEPVVAEMIERAGEACLAWVREGLTAAMNRFNN
ncbi:MAG TPA: aminoacyl-tRNA hydrolase [Candidatus Saccharimonadales bacterium]|nr:aminoacyl-tRNA hydrolase [Candidatus Saccharimonadales bacterium]